MEKLGIPLRPQPALNPLAARLRTACAARLLALLLLALPAAVQAQFNYATNYNTITITGYTGPGGDVTIPSTINGLPVTSIGFMAFFNCTSLTNIAIPNSVTSIGDGAFEACANLNPLWSQQRPQHRKLRVLPLHQPDQCHARQHRHQHREPGVRLLRPDQRQDPRWRR